MKVLVLGPKEAPLVKTYDEKDTVISINKYDNSMNFTSAGEISPYNHSLLTNGIIRDVLITISSKEELTQKDIINIVNKTPI